MVEYGSSAYLETDDELQSVNEDEVITNAIRPEPPVAPMPDLDELVEQVRSSLTEGAGFRGALGEVSRSVIEEVVWEVVPALAEAILKEEITRMIREVRHRTDATPHPTHDEVQAAAADRPRRSTKADSPDRLQRGIAAMGCHTMGVQTKVSASVSPSHRFLGRT